MNDVFTSFILLAGRMRFKILTAIIVCLNIGFLTAQNTSESRYLFANLFGQEHGLSQLNVKGIAADNLGYLWVGTEDGLFRFNGYEFKPFLHQPNDSNSIKDDHIRSLLFVSDTLWIASNTAGVAAFIPAENRFFYPLQNEVNPELKTSYKILKIGSDKLLFSLKNNFIVFNRITKKYKVFKTPSSEKETYVTDILKIDNNTFWISTIASGIFEVDSSFVFKRLPFFTNESVRQMVVVDGIIYFGTESGFYSYHLKQDTLKSLDLKLPVKSFFLTNNTAFYIGTAGGLFLYDIQANLVSPVFMQTIDNKLFSSIDYNQIVGDDNGNLWFGTEGEGLFHYNRFQKKFEPIKVQAGNQPNTENISTFQIMKGVDSVVWLGTKIGVISYDLRSKSFKHYTETDQLLIYTIKKDLEGNIWVGGFNSGVLLYNPINDSFEKVPSKNELPDNDIVEIIPIGKDTLWICTWAGGIHVLNKSTDTCEELRINGKRINRARTSFEDSNGNIWLGTDEGAYKVSKTGQLIHHFVEDTTTCSLSSNRIFSIEEDKFGNTWLGTSVGLTKLECDKKRSIHFLKQKGLPSDFVYSVQADEKNNIWLSTNFGISVLNTKTNAFRNFTLNDGLQNNEFNGKAGFKDEHGNIYFGGISGINIFQPENIIESSFLPHVYIESLDLFNKPIEQNELYKDTLYFKSKENVLSLNFAAINYLNTEKTDYTFIMEGFDNDWRPVTKNRSTTYTNLSPGEYFFRVKATNEAGRWGNAGAKTIIIIPAWYQTWTFKVLLILFFLAVGPIIYFYQTIKLRKDKIKLEYIVEQRTKDITEKKNELEKAFAEAARQRDNIRFLMRELRHRVKNNLQIITSLLNIQVNTLENKQAVNAVNMAKNRIVAISQIENKISVEKEIIRMDLFIKELCESILVALTDAENLKFSVEYDLEKVEASSEGATLLGLIINELVVNTTKYAFDYSSEENRLFISCKSNEQKIMVNIKDNGKGYSVEKAVSSSSMGLELVSDMVKQLKGKLVVNAENGVNNYIEIPI